MPTTPPDITYDVFISYSHRDKIWVRDELLPQLENTGLKVCLDYRDFRIGAPIIKEMERAVLTSRHPIAVLSPAYLESAWTDFEALMVATLDPGSQKERLLPLLLAPCDLPLRIKYIGYADFTAAEDAALAWQRLLVVLAVPGQPDDMAQQTGPHAARFTPPASSQPPPAPSFNTAAVRELLMAAFSDEEVVTICFDHFRPVYEQFAGGMSKPDKVHRLIAFCEQQGQTEQLLALVEQANPHQHNRIKERLRKTNPIDREPPDPGHIPNSLPPNPFTGVSTAKDAAHFVGRDTELRRLRAYLQNGSVVLLGEPKMGLSSLLRQVGRTWAGTVIGPLDCQGLDSRNDFYEYLAGKLGLTGHAWPPIREKLRSSELLFLVDELDAGPAHGIKLEDLGRFRAVAADNHNFRMVAVSHRPLKQVFPNTGPDSPGYSFLQPLTIGPLCDTDARILLEHPWAPTALQFGPAIRDELLKLAGGQPFKLHRAAFHRYEALADPTYDWLVAYRQDLENLL